MVPGERLERTADDGAMIRRFGWTIGWIVVLVALVVHVFGTGSTHHGPLRVDGWGGAFVTDAQMAAVKLGMTQSQVEQPRSRPA
jgi:hypothetical protein